MTEEELAIPSNRIRFALAALKEFEETPDCKVNMGTFRELSGAVCYACLGGAARIKRDGFRVSVDDDAWTDPAFDVFEDSLSVGRYGDIGSMFEVMELEADDGRRFSRRITDYEVNPDRFYADMEKLADDLEQAGY